MSNLESNGQAGEAIADENILKIAVTRNNEHIVSAQILDETTEGESERIESERGDGEKELSFQLISHNWFQLCLGLFEAFPFFRAVARSFHIHRAEAELVAHLDKVALSKEEVAGKREYEVRITYSVREQDSHRIFAEMIRLNQYKRAEKSISRAQLLSLLAEYEAFIADLLRLVIRESPEAFISKESTVQVSEVLKGASIDELKYSIIENRIESFQRDSHIEQVFLIFDKLKLARPDEKSVQEFSEICERRNMLTHSNGKVSKSYHAKLKKIGVKSEELPPIGHELRIDTHYMRRSIARVFLMGYFTLHIVWQHLRPDEKEKSIGMQINHSHDFLASGYTKMAGRLCDFVLNKNSPASELERAYAIINRALSVFLNPDVPKSERRDHVEKILAKRDWSIVDSKFSLALCCLREEYDRMPALVDDCVRDGLTADAFLTWALFTRAREQNAFKEKMKEHFGIEVDPAGN